MARVPEVASAPAACVVAATAAAPRVGRGGARTATGPRQAATAPRVRAATPRKGAVACVSVRQGGVGVSVRTRV